MNKLFHALFPSLGKSSHVMLAAVLAGLVFSPFYARAADAASLTVAVSQVNPNSAVQTVTCAAMQQGCSIPLVINAGQSTAQSLNIQVKYTGGALILMFHTSSGNYYAYDTGSTLGIYTAMWGKQVHGNQPITYNVTLVQLTTTLIGPQAVNASMGTYPPIANLQITVTPAS